MPPRLLIVCSVLAGVLWSGAVVAGERAFAYTRESRVLPSGASELEPWTTFRLGRQRYFQRLDGRLEFEHGVREDLQLALYWNFSTQTRDVTQDPLTGEVARVSESELTGASLELKYQLTDPSADLVGSALSLETTLGPRESEFEARLIADRRLNELLLAANLSAEYELEPIRDERGSELETAFILEPALAAGYRLAQNFSVGLELRAPLALSGESESATLFGGPVLSWADRRCWATLGVQPQLVAFSGHSEGSHLDLEQHERVEVRLLLGLLL